MRVGNVQKLDDFEGAFKAAISGRAGALIILQSAFTNTHRNRIVELAAKSRLPTMFEEAQLHSIGVQNVADLEPAMQTAVSDQTGALITITSARTFQLRKAITEFANKQRLPSMFEGISWVEMGGLMSYSTDDVEVFRRAAVYVNKILKGAKPANLPIEQPTKFELVINLKAAKQIGLTIPPHVLARADRVIK
jgi:ABC-type uncharacterized transport system substrate-binding protein